MSKIKRVIRGIRDSIPSGYILGRTDSGEGPPHLIKLADVKGAKSAPASIQTLLDGISSTRGSLLERGAAGWAGLSPSAANKVLSDGGAGADPSWKTLSALLDAVFGSAQGNILYRNSSAWVVLAPGTSGQVLVTGGASANPAWATAGVAGVIPLFRPTHASALSFSENKASRGNLLTPQYDMTFSDVWTLLTSVNSATYKAGYGAFNTGTGKLTTGPTFSAVTTEGSAAGAANRWLKLTFATPVVLTAGTKYLLFISRTDSTDTVTTVMNYLAADRFSPGMYEVATSASWNVGKAVPTTSDTWSSEAGTYIIDPVYTV